MTSFHNSRIVFLFLTMISMCLTARADDASPSSNATPGQIQLKGYQEGKTNYLFQLYLVGVPANQQPALKKMGDPVGWHDYVVGPFSKNMFKTSAGDSQPVMVDASTLELINPKTGHKIVLTLNGDSQGP